MTLTIKKQTAVNTKIVLFKNNILQFINKTHYEQERDFIQQITEGYSSKGESIILERALDGEALGNVKNTVKKH
jgi:hypothetical protein